MRSRLSDVRDYCSKHEECDSCVYYNDQDECIFRKVGLLRPSEWPERWPDEFYKHYSMMTAELGKDKPITYFPGKITEEPSLWEKLNKIKFSKNF